MKKIGRNAPCPCGSGKKYKRCCLGKDNEHRRFSQLREQAVDLAVDWLLQLYEEQANQELLEYFFESPEYSEHLEKLPNDVQQAVDTNALEWLVAEAWLTVGEVRCRALELVLGKDGPELRAEQRQWLEKMKENAIGLYEVLEIRSRETLLLQDLIDPERAPLRLVDPDVTEVLEVSSILGARLLPMDDHWLRTPALYLFERSRLEDLEAGFEEIRGAREMETEGAEGDDPWAFGDVVIGYWLIESFEGLWGSDDFELPILRCTSHFQVDDWGRLAARLEARDDVEGDRTGGWTRFVIDDDGTRDWLLALNPAANDRLDVFSCFALDDEEGREWLTDVAGGAVTFLDSEVSELPVEKTPFTDEYFDLPPAEKTARIQAFLEEEYRDWAGEPIPWLSGKPPLLAMQKEEGRAEVIRLLRRYEESERDAAATDGREPASYGFLWEAMGLDLAG